MLQSLGTFIIPVLSGYCILIRWNFTRYRLLKEPGYHLLFQSALIGVILFIISSGITLQLTFSGHIDLFQILGKLIPVNNSDTLPVKFAVTQSLILLLGLGLPLILNLFYSKQRATKKVAIQNGEFTRLLIDESAKLEYPIEFSLRSGKSYIGYAIETQFILQNNSDIALILMASGYRDKKTKKLIITTNHSEIFNYDKSNDESKYNFKIGKIDKNELRIVIPMSEIVSARYFEREIYDSFHQMVELVNNE